MTEDERQQWNAAIASSDTARMDQLRRTILRDINRDIMNDDSGYAASGWRPEEPR